MNSVKSKERMGCLCKIVKEITLELKEMMKQARWLLEKEWSWGVGTFERVWGRKTIGWNRVSIVIRDTGRSRNQWDNQGPGHEIPLRIFDSAVRNPPIKWGWREASKFYSLWEYVLKESVLIFLGYLIFFCQSRKNEKLGFSFSNNYCQIVFLLQWIPVMWHLSYPRVIVTAVGKKSRIWIII